MATVALSDHSRVPDPLDAPQAAMVCIEVTRDDSAGGPARGILLAVVMSVGMWAGILFLATLVRQ